MRTLLIVDDNVELASLLAVVAEVHGFAPRVAHTGLQALDLMEKEAPEAALVDLHLPDIAGQDLLKALKARGVMTFAMSGVFKGEQFAKAALETYGARAYFEKPFAARDAMVRMVSLVSAGPRPAPAPSSEPAPAARPAVELPTVEALIAKAQAEIAAQAVARAHPPAPAQPAPEADSEGEVPSVEELLAGRQAQAPGGLDLGEDESQDCPAPPSELPPLDAMESAQTSGIFAGGAAPPEPFEAEITIEPVGSAAPPPAPVSDEGPAETAEAEQVEGASQGGAPPVGAAPSPPPPAEVDVDAEAKPAAAALQAGALEPAPPPETEAEQPQPEQRETWAPPAQALRRQETPLDVPLPLHPGTVAALLSRFAGRRATGELRIKRGEVLKVIGLRDGQIVFAASNLSNERLPRWALRTGKLPATRVQDLQAELKKGARTCDALVSLGIVGPEERVKLIAGLVREIVWTLLDAEGGEAVFVSRAPPRKGLLPLALDPIAVVLRGYRQVFSLVRLRELVDAEKRFAHRQDLPWTPEELDLPAKEATLFAAADGSKTLEDLLMLSELEEREALVSLVALTHLGLLEARSPPRRRVVLG